MRFPARLHLLLCAGLLLFAALSQAEEKTFLPALPDIALPELTDPATAALPLPSGGSVVPGEYTRRLPLDGTWRISGLENSVEPFPADIDLDKNYQSPDFADGGWDEIAVPLNWYKKYPKAMLEKEPYVKGWYRRSVNVPADWAGGRMLLRFGVVGYEGLLFVNGKQVGSHHGDFTPWEVDITDAVKPGAENVIALRVFSDFGNKKGKARKATHVYGSQWSIGNIKGGIWQPAELVCRPAVYVKRVLVTSDLAAQSVRLDYAIVNGTGKKAALELVGAVVPALASDAANAVAGQSLGRVALAPGETEGTCVLPLKQPRLWSVNDPYLHYLTLALREGDKTVDAKLERFGFRDFRVEGTYFCLNGERVFLFGENLPSVRFGGYGVAAEEEREGLFQHLAGFKRQGTNIIRNAHMPITPAALEIADEIGIMFYNEWGWSFTNDIDEPEFEKRNSAEIIDWLHRDYNYPSVVMWSMGNEVRHQDLPEVQRQMNHQVKLMRELDHQKRPVGTFSGSADFGSYGTTRLETDFLDLHDYLGLSTRSWTTWEKQFASHYAKAADIYGKDGKLEIPYIIWEYCGFSWGGKKDGNFKVNDINAYSKYARGVTSWAQPNGIGFSGTIGLANSLAHGTQPGQERYGKRISQILRQIPEISGFAPWFHGSNLPVASIWNQPMLPGLRSANSAPLRNVFAGETYPQQLYVANDSSSGYANVDARVALVDGSGNETEFARVDVGELKPWSKNVYDVNVTIPACKGEAQMRVLLMADGKEVGRNFFNLFVQDKAILNTPIKTEKKVVLFRSRDGGPKTAAILNALGVAFTEIDTLEKSPDAEVLILPPMGYDDSLAFGAEQSNVLLNWAKEGGILLQLEQNYTGTTPLQQQQMGCANTFVDLVIPAHPVFNGLGRPQFDIWQNPEQGSIVTHGSFPFTENALAVRGPFLGTTLLCNAVSEGTVGKGRILSSQLLAVEMWGQDSAASVYLHNLLSYVLTKPSYDARPWSATQDNSLVVHPESMVAIDLRPFVNMGFRDEQADDGKGGWSDQGPDNDFSSMPLGKQTFCGVPFEIIDPAKNGGKGAIVLRGQSKAFLPEATPEIPVGQNLSRLFFLHTLAWGGSSATVGRYVMTYEDGTDITAEIVSKSNVDDWWHFGFLPEALLAFTRPNGRGADVGMFLYAWENPYPEKRIVSLRMASESRSTLPILVAVSGEKAEDEPLVIDGGGQEVKWSALSYPDRGNSPDVAHEADGGPFGKGCRVIEMPANRTNAVPAAFVRFPKPEGREYRYLTFWLKAETPGAVDVVLPRESWNSTLSSQVLLHPGKEWRKIRLDLGSQMGLDKQDWGLKELRGEFFLYNRGEKESQANLKFRIADIRLE